MEGVSDFMVDVPTCFFFLEYVELHIIALRKGIKGSYSQTTPHTNTTHTSQVTGAHVHVRLEPLSYSLVIYKREGVLVNINASVKQGAQSLFVLALPLFLQPLTSLH
jgi:hypothetical protein